MKKHSDGKHGFTLIEMSIVLVIIAFLVGAIFVGYELIKAAEIRGVVSEAQSYKAAYSTFLSKYGCVAGDCKQSDVQAYGLVGLGSSNPANVNACQNTGNGDGLIQSHSGISTNGCGSDSEYESYDFWGMLQAANLVTRFYLTKGQPKTNQLTTKLGKGQWVATSFQPYFATPMGGNFLVIDNAPNNSQDPWGQSVLSPVEAFAIDSKIDDGMPMSGAVRASYSYFKCGDGSAFNSGVCFNKPLVVSTIGVVYPGYHASEACVDDTVAIPIYNTSRTSTAFPYSCEISIQLQ